MEKETGMDGKRNAEQEGKTETHQMKDVATLKAKRRKRHVRAFRDLMIRFVLLSLVVYVLFFHLVGLTVMPSADMYPRIDAGDLVLYYRLERSIHAQDIIAFEKPTSSLEQSYAETEEAREGIVVDKPADSLEQSVEITGEADVGSTDEKTDDSGTGEEKDKPFWRKALDWLGFRDPDEPEKTFFICRVVAGPGDTVEFSENERLLVNGNAVIETNIFYSTPEYTGFVNYPLKLGEGEYFVLADRRNGGADSRFFGAVREEEILGTVITIVRRNNL